jgi:hypothetical protein
VADNTLMYAALDRTVAAAADGTWNQKMWVEINECGSAFCYAGHLLHMQGWQAVRLPDQPSWSTFGLARNGEILTWTGIGERAAQELGLTNAEADALFEEDNDLERLKMLVDEIANGTFEEPEPIVFTGCVEFPEPF